MLEVITCFLESLFLVVPSVLQFIRFSIHIPNRRQESLQLRPKKGEIPSSSKHIQNRTCLIKKYVEKQVFGVNEESRLSLSFCSNCFLCRSIVNSRRRREEANCNNKSLISCIRTVTDAESQEKGFELAGKQTMKKSI